MKKLKFFKWRNVTIDQMVERQKTLFCKGYNYSLRNKFLFLSHAFIARCLGRDKGVATFNANLLKKVLGDVYTEMIATLVSLGLIKKGFYTSTTSTSYSLVDMDVTLVETANKKVIEYNKKMKKLLSEYLDSKVTEYSYTLPDSLRNPYRDALKSITLDVGGALDYVSSSSYYIEAQRQYRYYRTETFNDDSCEVRTDMNHRLYSKITSFPNDLLGYTNISYELDCANCHPLLFAIFLNYVYHSTYNSIYNDLYTPSNIDHYVSEILSKTFSDSELHGLKEMYNAKNSIPDDVINYIRLVSEGRFWDVILSQYDSEDRKSIKKKLFAEVFYSKSTSVYIRDRNYYVVGERKYALDFKQNFPNVWKIIVEVKRVGRQKGSRTFLPNYMMKLESRIFHSILQECYNSGINNVASIHDAIVVVGSKDASTCDRIRDIMMKSFSQYGLSPTIKISKLSII